MFAMRRLSPETPEESEKEETENGEESTQSAEETFADIWQRQLRQQLQRPGRLAPEGTLPQNPEQANPTQIERPPPPPPERRRRFGRGGSGIASVLFS